MICMAVRVLCAAWVRAVAAKADVQGPAAAAVDARQS